MEKTWVLNLSQIQYFSMQSLDKSLRSKTQSVYVCIPEVIFSSERCDNKKKKCVLVLLNQSIQQRCRYRAPLKNFCSEMSSSKASTPSCFTLWRERTISTVNLKTKVKMTDAGLSFKIQTRIMFLKLDFDFTSRYLKLRAATNSARWTLAKATAKLAAVWGCIKGILHPR